MKKRGQVTLYIILGFLMLLIAVAALYFKSDSDKANLFDEYKKEKVSSEFEPVRQYIQACIYQTSVDGLVLAGEHGGHIAINDPKISSESFDITNEPTESDAVRFSQKSSLEIPYWHYLESGNSCTGSCAFGSKMPSLSGTDNSVEKQLERYIVINLKDCIDSFKPLVLQGFQVTESGSIKADIEFIDGKVLVYVDYPIEASKEAKAKLTKFYNEVQLDLEAVYSLGMKITSMEKQHRFFEKALINLIGGFSGLDTAKIPPFSDMRVGWNPPVRWMKSDVKKKVSGILTSYIQLFQVDGTANYERNTFDSELRQTLYDYFIIPVADPEYMGLEASFSYLDSWQIYFDLNCNGELCEPQSANSPFFNLLGIQRYQFSYDASYPVLVEINDPAALNNRGYTFRFFIEANVRNNEPMPSDFSPLNATSAKGSTMLCDYEQRQSSNITIKVTDKFDRSPISGATVTYSVAGESCFIGTTSASGALTAKFPTGSVGGIVTLIQEDHLMQSMLFDPGGKNNNVEIGMQPMKKMKFIVKKKNFVKQSGSWVFVDQAIDLDSEEEAFVSLERKGTSEEQDFSTGAYYSIAEKEIPAAYIASGDYEMTIDLLSYKDMVIPERHVKESGMLGQDVEYTLPRMDFGKTNPFLEGQLELNISVTGKQVKDYNTIVFYVNSFDVQSIPEESRQLSDIEVLGKSAGYLAGYEYTLQPTFANT